MILGERGPGRIVLVDLEREDELLAGEEVGVSTPKKIHAPRTPNEDASKKEKEKERKLRSGEQPGGTATSMRDAREVEDVVGLFDGDGDAIMDVDVDVNGARMAMAVDNDYDGGEEDVSPSKALTARMNARKSRNDDPEEEEEVISRSKASKERKGETKSRDDDYEDVEKVLPLKVLKARKKAKNRDDEEEEGEFLSPKVMKERKKVRKSRDDYEEEESEQKVEKPKNRLIRRAGVTKEVAKKKTTEKMKAKEKEKVPDEPGPSSKSRPRKVILPDPTDDSDSVVEIPVKAKGKAKSKNAPVKPNLDDGSDYSVEKIYVKAKASAQAKPKPAARPLIDDTDEGDDSDEPRFPKKSPYTSISKGKGKAVDVTSPIRTPKRVVSVVLPSVGSSKQKPALTRTESLRVEADEASISSSKRARPVKGGDLVPDSHSGGRRLLGGDNIGLTPLPPKRSALIKATNHLHNVAMPDLMSYAQEKKRGFKGKDEDRISDMSRETSTAGKARKRRSDILSDPPTSDEEAERKRKRKISASGLSKESAQPASDEWSEVETRPRKVTKKVRLVSGHERSDDSSSEKIKGKRSVLYYDRGTPTHSIKSKVLWIRESQRRIRLPSS